MKTFKLLILMFLSVVILNSCTDDFEELNTNPNTPDAVTPNLLLSTITSDVPNRLVRIGWYNGNIVSQLSAKNNFVDFDVYQWGTETGSWNDFYNTLSNIQDIIRLSELENNGTYHGIALVMKAVTMAQLTDNWGNVPMSEAIKGVSEGNFTPKYDTQQEIYNEILNSLAEAIPLLEKGDKILGGDLIYEGSNAQWIKLANSLRLRYLLRVSKQEDVSARMQEIVTGGAIFTSNNDNAVLKYSASTNVDSWFLSTYRIGTFDEFSLSQTALNYLEPINDPRLDIWYDKSSKTGEYGGIPNGLNQDNARDFDSDNGVSRLDQALFFNSKTDVEASIMKYSELQFILAEARQRGFISTGEAKDYYENGVRATMNYWGVNDDNAINNYIAKNEIAFNNTIERIITQKWLANFLVDNQSWYDYRRTGFPSFLTPGPDNVNSNVIPVRYLYPDNEQTLNTANYEANIAVFGENNINTKVWWETGTRY